MSMTKGTSQASQIITLERLLEQAQDSLSITQKRLEMAESMVALLQENLQLERNLSRELEKIVRSVHDCPNCHYGRTTLHKA